MYAIQPSYVMDLMRHITKWSQRLTVLGQVKHSLTDAFKDAQVYPKGPVALEFEFTGTLGGEPAGRRTRDFYYVLNWGRGKTAAPIISLGGERRRPPGCGTVCTGYISGTAAGAVCRGWCPLVKCFLGVGGLC